MSRWPRRELIAVYVATCLVMALISAALYVLSGYASLIQVSLLAVTYPCIGATILAYRPDSVPGRLLAVTGAILALSALAESYSYYSVVEAPNSLPFENWAAWFTSWSFGVGWGFMLLTVLLFPNGRLPSPRWSWPTILLGTAFCLAIVVVALYPAPLADVSHIAEIQNPIGLPIVGSFAERARPLLVLLVPAVVLTPVAAIAMRLRRSSGIERRQLEWFTLAVAIAAATFLLRLLLQQALSVQAAWLISALSYLGAGFLFFGLPAAVAVAILRHNLFDIDIILNRTLVYGLISASLGSVYVGGILLFQFLFQPLTARSDLAIVLSTLGVAALFQPVQRNAQAIIDRRFYRRKYDAEQTLDAFRSIARDEVDLDRLCGALTRVANETMQPAHVSIWIRER